MNDLSGLNNAQKRAVKHTKGPLLVVAGAGAGKTKTITARIISLIRNGTEPRKILAVTFTNKAAREMKERVEHALTSSPLGIGPYEKPLVLTFHGLGAKMLKSHAHRVGKTSSFSIFDREDSISAIKKILNELGVDPKETEPRKILGKISRAKGEALTWREYAGIPPKDPLSALTVIVWEKYEAALLRANAFDFDDLISVPLLLLETIPDVRNEYQSAWDYIHIDEYQDTNTSQYRLARILSLRHGNICVVGDSDQSIYSWRGADYENILSFEEDFPGATTVVLNENYRSTKNILSLANKVIEKNVARIPKELITKNKDGEKISLVIAEDEVAEATFVAETVRTLLSSKASGSDIAVLFRTNFQSRILEETFISRSIPHEVLGIRFLARKEVKDVVAYLRAATNERDYESLGRIINFPARGIGKVTVAKLFSGKEGELSGSIKEKVSGFFALLAKIKEQSICITPKELVQFVVREAGIEKTLLSGGDDDLERLENIRELATIAGKYDKLPPEEGIREFLSDIALLVEEEDAEEKKGKSGVKLMTVHAAKGLEFSHVFVVGLEEGLFPHEGFPHEGRDEEEERRLFYVAVTRAKEKLYLSYAQTRTIYGALRVNTPSEFLFDIDDSLLTHEEVEKNTIRVE